MMSESITKTRLADRLRAAHADLQAAIDGLTEEQLNQTGVIGRWSVKDLIAHLTYWERRAAFLMESAISGYHEEDDIWKIGSVDNQNERNFQENKTRPAADVLADWRSVLWTLLSILERLPEDHLNDGSRFGWAQNESLGERIEGESFGHIEEHWPDLEKGLASLSR